MGSWKKLIMGEKMPDKNDPKYAERYEREVSAGRKFARWLKIDKAAGYAQMFACKHPKWFLGLVFGIVIGCLSLNIYRIVQVCNRPEPAVVETATQKQERLLEDKKVINNDFSRNKEKD